MQYFYYCRDAAEEAQKADSKVAKASEPCGEALEDIEMSELINIIQLTDALLSKKHQDQLDHAEKAVRIARHLGMLGQHETASWSPSPDTISLVNTTRHSQITKWTDSLHKMNTKKPAVVQDKTNQPDHGDVNQLDTVFSEASAMDVMNATVEYAGDVVAEGHQDSDISMLSEEQQRAYTIVKDHLDNPQNSKNLPQLLLHTAGKCGTGKSLIISKITDLLWARGELHTLHKAAYTGIAASFIEGSTIHKLAELHLKCENVSNRAVERLWKTWKDTKWLIIDEILDGLQKIFWRSVGNDVYCQAGAWKEQQLSVIRGCEQYHSWRFQSIPSDFCTRNWQRCPICTNRGLALNQCTKQQTALQSV